jgi:ribulose-5-phosphate 4-epimerase/fuculose-1-phosphate aldolase
MSRRFRREHKVANIACLTSSDDAYKLSHAPQFQNTKQYVEAKLRMLMDPHGFCIYPTKKEIEHLYELSTESEINRAVRQIINNHWR